MQQSERGVNLEQGEVITLKAAGIVAGAQVNTAGTAVVLNGERKKYIFVLDVTNCDTAAGDTLNVFIDVLVNSFWINAVHFTERIGTDGAVREYAVLDTTTPGVAVVVATADAAAAAVRPTLFGSQIRGRWTLVETATTTFTFSLTGYAV